MNKNGFLLLPLALILLLCACTQSEIACGIDGADRAFLRYDLELDLRELSMREQIPILTWLREEAKRLEAQGFTVEHNAITVTDEPTWLRAELIRAGADRSQALTLLREMLTDETLTPFTAVVCEGDRQTLQEALRVRLTLEPGRVLDTVGMETWPKRLREQTAPWIEAGSLRLTLTLPATELPAGETAELAEGLATKTLTLPLDGSGELELTTLIYTGGGDNAQVWWKGADRSADSADALAASMAADEAALDDLAGKLTIGAVALGALAVLLFVWGTLRRRTRKTDA